ncbi:MAG: TonB-dependent receptor [Parvularculaceae bacterium]
MAIDLPAAPVTNENYGAWGRFDWSLGDNITVTSITSADTVSKYQVLDADTSPAPQFELAFTVDHDQFSQELRVAGGGSKFDWLVGGYYYKDHRFFTVGFPQLGGYGSFADQDIETYAFFGQATYALTSSLNLTGGLRYTDDKRDLNEIAAVLGTVPGTRQGLQLYNTSRAIDENKVTWRAALDWRLNEMNMVYASVSTGFKSGAFNALYPGAVTNVTTALPESTTSYEIGLKGATESGVLGYNFAAFYTDYEDVQAAGTIVIGGTPQSALSNVADATIWGLEGDIVLNPFDGLTATFAAGYLDAEYKAPATALFNGVPIDGKRPVMTPEFSFSGSFRYEHPVPVGGRAHIAADANWTDKVYFGPENYDTESMDAYALLNLHVGWTSENSGWRIAGPVRNVTNKRYFTHAVDGAPASPFQTGFTVGMPRTWTIDISHAF